MTRALVLLFLSVSALAEPVRYKSKRVEWDLTKGEAIAKDGVELLVGDYKFVSESLTYSRDGNLITMPGYTIAHNLTKAEELKAEDIKIDLANRYFSGKSALVRVGKYARFASQFIEYRYPQRATLWRSRYTTCAPCNKRKLQWEIRAGKIVTQVGDDTQLFNSTMRMYDIPILYLPYFRMPSPGAEPKSGFLTPKNFTYRSAYGLSVDIPYYLRFNDHHSLTYTASVTSKQGVRHRFDQHLQLPRALLKNQVEFTKYKGDSTLPHHRYYVSTQFGHQINEKLWLSSEVNRTSDTQYLNQYHNRKDNYFHSNLTVRYVDEDAYGSASMHSFQNLQSSAKYRSTSNILPLIRYNRTDHLSKNSSLISSIRFASTVRDPYVEIDPFYSINLVHRSVTSLNQGIVTIAPQVTAISVRGKDGMRSKATPSASIEWSKSLFGRVNKTATYIEPRVSLVISPNSRFVTTPPGHMELSESNLFMTNRYLESGFLEGGSRLNYAVSGKFLGDKQEASYFVGQSLLLRKSDQYPLNSGMHNKNLSDLVSKLTWSPTSRWKLSHRGRLDCHERVLRKNEIDVEYSNPNKYKLSLAFGSYSRVTNSASTLAATKLLSMQSDVYIKPGLVLHLEFMQGFDRSSSFKLYSSIGLKHETECAIVSINFARHYAAVDKRKKGAFVNLNVRLKGLNDVFAN